MAIILSLFLINSFLPSMHAFAVDDSLDKMKSKDALIGGTRADFPSYEFHTTILIEKMKKAVELLNQAFF